VTDLLTILHASENPCAFVQLYAAIKEESHLQWLVERIDQFTDQSVTDLMNGLDINKATGECERKCDLRLLRLEITFSFRSTFSFLTIRESSGGVWGNPSGKRICCISALKSDICRWHEFWSISEKN